MKEDIEINFEPKLRALSAFRGRGRERYKPRQGQGDRRYGGEKTGSGEWEITRAREATWEVLHISPKIAISTSSEKVLESAPTLPEEDNWILHELGIDTASEETGQDPDARPSYDALSRLHRIILEKATITRIWDEVPGIEAPSHWNLLLHSLFGEMWHSSSDKGGRVYKRQKISAKLLAEMEGKQAKYASKKYVGSIF